MPSSNPTAPIPVPVNGVLANRTPLAVGGSGLVASNNMIYRDGRFISRPGLDTFAVGSIGGGATGTNMYSAAISKMSGPVADLYEDTTNRDWFDNHSGEIQATSSVFAPIVSIVSDSTYFAEGSESLAITFTGDSDISWTTLTLQLPVVSVDADKWYGFSLYACKAGETADVSVSATLRLFNDTGSSNPPYTSEALASDTVTEMLVTDGVDPGTWSRIYSNDSICLFNSDGYDYGVVTVQLRVKKAGNVTVYLDKLMFTEANDMTGVEWVAGGSSRTPGVTIGQRPMGLTQYDITSDNSGLIVTATNPIAGVGDEKGGWFYWDVDGGVWVDITESTNEITTTSQYDHHVFRIFDIGNPNDSGSPTASAKYLIGVTENEYAKFWNGNVGDPPSTPPDAYDDIENANAVGTERLKAKTVACSFDRVLYGNVLVEGGQRYPDAVLYTDYLTYDAWNALQIIRLADTPGELVSLMEMGNKITVAYKSDAIYMIIAQGGSVPFRAEMKSANVDGPASALAVVQLDDGSHAYLSVRGDMIVFDGHQPRSMGPHIHAYLRDRIDFNEIGKSTMWYDRGRKELYVLFQEKQTADIQHCVMIQLSDPANPTLWPIKWHTPMTVGINAFVDTSPTIDSLGLNPIDSYSNAIDDWKSFSQETLLCEYYGDGYVASGHTDNGLPIDVYFKTGLFQLAEQTRYITIHEIDHRLVSNGDEVIEVDLITSTYGESREDGSEKGIASTGGSDPIITTHRETDRLFQLAFSGSIESSLEWIGSEATYFPRGKR